MTRTTHRGGARAFVLAIAMLTLALAAPAAAQAGYVQRSGTNLTLDGSQFRFAGHNNYQLTSDRTANQCGRVTSDATLGSILDDAKNSGAKVIRTWFFQSYYRNAGNSYTPFDRVLNAAAARGLKVVPVLVNHYSDCEPSAGNEKDEGFYDYGYKQASWGYPQSYRDFAYNVAVRYKNNDTVAFWQLVNEAETSYNDQQSCNTSLDANGHQRSANVLRAFADDMATLLKTGDPNHLVSLGTIGAGQCGAGGAEYQYVHSGSVDLCEYHDYGDPTHSLPDDGYNRLKQRIDQCNTIGKPLFIGEAAIVADTDDNGGSSGSITSDSVQRRAGFIDAKMTAAFANGVDGYALWEKIPDATNSSYNLNNGRYGIGPNSLFSDPTNSVTTQQAASFGGGAGTVRSGFEDGTAGGWQVAWGTVSLANSTTQAWGGFKSLALGVSGAGYPAVRTLSTSGAGVGTKITYRVYKPASAPSSVGVKPYVSNNGWAQTFGSDVSLSYGWNTVTFTVPAGLSTPLQAIGLQVNNGGGWTGSLLLDDVSW